MLNLSLFTYHFLLFTHKICSKFCLFPTKLLNTKKSDEHPIQVCLETNPNKILAFKFSFYCNGLYSTYRLFSIYDLMEKFGMSSQVAIHLFLLFICQLGLCCQYFSAYRGIADVIFVHKNTLEIFKKFKIDIKNNYWWCFLIPQITICNGNVFNLTKMVFPIYFVYNLRSPTFLISHFPEFVIENPISIILFAIFEIYVFSSAADAIILSFSFIFEFIYNAKYLLRVTSRIDDSVHKLGFEEKCAVFNHLLILNRIYNSTTADLLLVAQVQISTLCVIGIYISLFVHDQMNIITWSIFPIFASAALFYTIFMFAQYSELLVASKKFMEITKHDMILDNRIPKNGFGSKVVMTFRGFGVKFGPFGLIDLNLILFLTDSIVSNYLTLERWINE